MKYKLTIGLLKLVALLPFWVLYALSDVMFFIIYYVVRYRRKLVRKNLRRAFPNDSPAQIKRYERGFYRHLCDIFVETVKLLHFSDKEVGRRIKIEGTDKVNETAAAGRSIVVMLGHYGNWEWVPSIVTKLTENIHAAQIYHPLKNKNMDRVMLKIRSRFGSESIPMARTVRRLLELERDNQRFICGFIADQRPFTAALHHWTDFMGIDTPYVTGGETIGDRINAAYFYLDVDKTSRGHYTLTFKEIVPPEGDTEEFPYTRQYLRMLERSIRRDPRFWLWSHNRWKRSRTTNPKH